MKKEYIVETLCLIFKFLWVVMILGQKQVCRIITIVQVRLTQVIVQQLVIMFTPRNKVEKGKKSCWGCGSESRMLSQCQYKSKSVTNTTVNANIHACTLRPSSMLTSHNSIVATDDSCEVKYDGCNVMTATEVDTDVHSHVTDSLVHSLSEVLVTNNGVTVTDAAVGSLTNIC